MVNIYVMAHLLKLPCLIEKASTESKVIQPLMSVIIVEGWIVK